MTGSVPLRAKMLALALASLISAVYGSFND
jgi:hypothetical protein